MARACRIRFQVLTANRLIGGEVVYAARRGWTENFAEADVIRTPETADERLKAAQADIGAGLIVEPYLFDVEEADGFVRPVSVRETLRTRGPSVRPDLGKQAGRRPE